MAEAPKLRVIDGGTGQVVQEDGSLLPQDYALQDEEIRRLRRQVSALKGQLSRLQKVDPQAATIESVLTHWKLKLRGPTSRVQIPLDGARADAVRKALRRLIENDEDPDLANPKAEAHADATKRAEDRAVGRILAAIDGCARCPFEQYGQHFPEPGPGRTRRDELTYILANEVRMEKLADLIEADERRIAYQAELWRMLQTQPNLRLILATLGPEPCGEIIARAVRWCCANA